MTIRLICIDADDTLWHSERHFVETKAAMVMLLLPFTDADLVSSTLERINVRNMDLYGYSAKGFTLSMIEVVLDLCPSAASSAVISDIPAVGREPLTRPVEVFKGVAEALDELQARGPLFL